MAARRLEAIDACRIAAFLIPTICMAGICVPIARGASLEFATAPKMPTLTAVTLNGKSQAAHTTMASLAITDTRGSGSGWNVTVEGQSGTGKSAVFAQYCPKANCGGSSEGYIAGGQKMAANSLKLNSTGASFTGGTGTAPTLKCSTSCNVDSASAVKIASAAIGAGEGTWTTTGFSTTSLALTVPTTLRSLPNEEVYRVNLLWTLASGP